ncbi:hypothetical protein [Burkholderia savannae]|uniref:hypothetical protein n=1 Tax=Burkholderia savannae TaxID=1637837 RepID=UPI0012F5246C|nr:hypothetical protein [Burkholderia savannae]
MRWARFRTGGSSGDARVGAERRCAFSPFRLFAFSPFRLFAFSPFRLFAFSPFRLFAFSPFRPFRPFHRFTVSPFHRFIVSSFHRFIDSSIHRFDVSTFRRSTGTLERLGIAAWRHRLACAVRACRSDRSTHALDNAPFPRTNRFTGPKTAVPDGISARADRAATDFTHCYARRSSNDDGIPYTAAVQ